MNNQVRSLNNSTADIDMENQIITFSVASEMPFQRQDSNGNVYNEILLMSEDSVNLARLKGGASILKNHDDDEILGTVLDAWIADKKLYVKAQFRLHDEKVNGIFKDICEGIIKNVSLGYIVDDIVFKKENGKVNGYCKITPFEASVAVGVPADPSVGFYRSMTDPNNKGTKTMVEDKEEKSDVTETEQLEQLKKRLEELEQKLEEVTKSETKEIDEQPNSEQTADEENPTEEEKPAEGSQSTETVEDTKDTEEVEQPLDEQNVDEEEIKAVARAFKREDLIADALERKIDVSTFKRELKNKINNKGNIKIMEQRKFDVAKALRSLVMNGVDASYEREMTQEAYRKAGMNVNDTAIVLREFNGTTGAGLMPTNHRGDLFVDLLKTKLAVKNAKILPGLQGTTTIPTAVSLTDVNWVEGLNNRANQTNPVISSITLSPKKLTAYVDIEKDILINGNPDPINLVINQLMDAIAIKLDNTILKGNLAAPYIAGVEGTTGVHTVEIADINSATYRDMLKFSGAVGSFAMANKPEFIMSAYDYSILEGTSKDVGSGRYILENGQINSLNANICGSLNAGDIYFGDFSKVIIGNWLSGLQLTVDQCSLSISGGYRIVATLIADVAVTNPNGFVKRVASAPVDPSGM